MDCLLFNRRMDSIKQKRRYLSPEIILDEILRTQNIDDYICIILGRTGPTGKSWICEKLKNNGFRAVEISENIYKKVDYTDSNNHCVMDGFHKTITIILNRSLR